MLKQERLARIAKAVNEKGTISVNEITEKLKISDMTARRDLDELEKAGKLIRFHGGAQSIHHSLDPEQFLIEKTDRNLDEKIAVGKYAAGLVEEGETIFLGAGTTLELMARHLNIKDMNIRVITNSYPVFELLCRIAPDQVILAAGCYDSRTGSFYGPLCNTVLRQMNFHKAFFSCSGIAAGGLTLSSFEEGETNQIALNHAKKRYLLMDHQKFNQQDFHTYYSLRDLDLLVTDDRISQEVLDQYRTFCPIHTASTASVDPLHP